MKITKRTILAATLLALLAVIPAIKGFSKDRDITTFSSDSTINLNEEVTAVSVAKWISQAKKLDEQNTNKPIILAVNSPGGDIVAGIDFIEAMKGLRRPVKTVTIFAASMAFQIVQNMSSDRLILKNGILMSHRASGGICESCEFGGTSPSQTDSRYQFWLNRLRELDEQTVTRTNGKQTLESYQKAYANEMWKTGSQSVADGYADKVVTATCDSSLNGKTAKTANVMGMQINYSLSNCPLITGPLDVSMTISSTLGPMPETEFLARGGQFGPACLLNQDPKKLCSLDTTLSIEKITELKQKFSVNYSAQQQKVIYMHIF